MTSLRASSSPLGFAGAGVGKESGVDGCGSGVEECDAVGVLRADSFEGSGLRFCVWRDLCCCCCWA